MRIQQITTSTKTAFMGKIIDAHAHIGNHEDKIYTKGSLDVYVKSPLPNGDIIEKIVVSDLNVLHGITNEFQGNYKTKCEFENDTHYAILASCNPKNGNIKEIQRLYQENPKSFIGLKFHPGFNKLPPTDIKYEPYYKFAEKYNLPCLFHTAVNVNEIGILSKDLDAYSDPEYIYTAAKRHPKTPFIFAHLGAGFGESHDKATDIIINSIKNGDANLYADISWVDIDNPNINGHSTKEHIIKAIKKFKGIGVNDWKFGDQSFRLLFGTDIPLARFHDWFHPDALKDYAKFVEDIKCAIRNDKILAQNAEKIIENLFYNNAKQLYLYSHKIPKIL